MNLEEWNKLDGEKYWTEERLAQYKKFEKLNARYARQDSRASKMYYVISAAIRGAVRSYRNDNW